MQSAVQPPPVVMAVSRRGFIHRIGTVSLSATAVALLAGCESMATDEAMTEGKPMADTSAKDVSILNVALGLEHEAITAYQLGAESSLLQKTMLDVAVGFQSQHKAHRDALAGTIRKMGGSAVASKSKADYARDLHADRLKNQTDVLRLAARLERGAANTYLGVIPSLNDPALDKVAGRLAADEVMHWTVLAQVLGQKLPDQALSFGA